ncbi:BTAD domain-containing putative transcriptional regulator [Plantactinospora sp. GCM10030261]|uniref:AfsR/SARP family transcriptional regulator n=1 Tax=Plantactinospora sp. GCM10030261 TaxID=3273420 RepID=UPI00361FFBC0
MRNGGYGGHGEPVTVRLLGRVELTVDDRTVPLSKLECGLVAVLALAARQVVSTDTLIDRLWGADPPSSARTRVQALVSRIRRAAIPSGPGHHVITTVAPGYLLAHRILDVEQYVRFADTAARLREAGRLEAAAERLREASALWRGDPLDGAPEPVRAAEAHRLTELRLTGIEDRIAIEFDLGRYGSVLPELTRLVAAHPLRERIRAQLMRALSATGRQAEALALYHEGRRVLDHELGIPPGPELRATHEAVLVGAAAVTPTGATSPPSVLGESTAAGPAAPSPAVVRSPSDPGDVAWPVVPNQLPPDDPRFVGRRRQIDKLTALFATGFIRPAPGLPVIAVITGMAGSGKTALAVRFAWRVRDGYPDGCLYADLRGQSAAPASPHELTGTFLRALGVPGAAIPEPADERLALYRSVLADRRVLLVLDNAANEAQVRPLLPGGGGNGLLVTARNRLAGLTADRLPLGMLTEAEGLDLFDTLVGPHVATADPGAVRRVLDKCGRLPLAIRIAGARIATTPGMRVDELAGRLRDEARRLDELSAGDLHVRASLSVAYQSLDGPGRHLLRMLGLLPAPHVTVPVAAALLDQPTTAVAGQLDALAGAHLLQPYAPPGRDTTRRYRLHDLVQLYARERAMAEETDRTQAAALDRAHRTLLDLAIRADRSLPARSFPVPAGWARPGPVPDPPSAAPVAWFDTERDLLLAAVRQAATGPSPELAARLVAVTINYLAMTVRFADWERMVTVAAEGLARVDPRLFAAERAVLAHARGALLRGRYEARQALPWLRQARRLYLRAGDPVGAASVATELGMVARLFGAPRVADAQFRWALDRFAADGPVVQEGYAHIGIGNLWLDEGRADGRIETAFTRAVSVFRAGGDVRGEANAVACLGALHRREGRAEAAAGHYRRAVALLESIGDDFGLAMARQGLAEIHLDAGDLATARRLADSVRAGFERLRHGWGTARAARTLGRILLAEGRYREAVAELDRAVSAFRAVGDMPSTAATLLDLSRARAASAAEA